MMFEEKNENNKLVAEFMNIPKCKRCSDCGAYQYGPGVIFFPFEMQYNEKWDWLMPVVLKIISDNKSCFSVMSSGYLSSGDMPLIDLLPDDKMRVQATANTEIEAMYSAVVEYLKLKNKINS